MATISFTKTDKGPYHTVYRWTPVTEADVCAPVKIERPFYGYAMQVSGTFGSATMTLQGSVDGTNYAALTDADANSVARTTAGINGNGRDLALYFKPVTSGGTSSSLTVSLLVVHLP